MKKARRKFLGVRAVKSVSRSKRATKREPHGAANMRIPHMISGCNELMRQFWASSSLPKGTTYSFGVQK